MIIISKTVRAGAVAILGAALFVAPFGMLAQAADYSGGSYSGGGYSSGGTSYSGGYGDSYGGSYSGGDYSYGTSYYGGYGDTYGGGGDYTYHNYSYTPPKVKNPTCTLSASDTSITQGETVVLTWSSNNANYAYMTNIGSISVDGSATVSPQETTTYAATFTGQNNRQVTCSKTINVSQVVQPTCSITASPSTINRGQSATINWSSSNASAGSINQGIGNVALSGSQSVSPQNTTTYTATFTKGNKTVNCSTTVYVNDVVYNAPSCNIYVNNYNQNYNQYTSNQPVTIYWTSNNANYGWINQGIGTVQINGSRVVYPTQSTTYTATFTGYNGQQVNCSVTVNINGYIPPVQPPYVTLSAVPYTGLDLGPTGTALYWAFLIAWCVFAAYLIAVKRVHMSIYRWYSNTLFGTAPTHAAVATSYVAPVRTTPVVMPQSDAVDPFILSQVNRAR